MLCATHIGPSSQEHNPNTDDEDVEKEPEPSSEASFLVEIGS